MSNITIIDKISERQQRMEEKYFGQNANKLLQQNSKCQSEYQTMLSGKSIGIQKK